MTISQMAGDVRGLPRIGTVGELVYANYLNKLTDIINKAPQAAQTHTVTVDTATNDATYTISINSVTITFTADSSATKIEIAAGIAAAINAEPSVRAVVSAVSDGVDVVTVTSVVPGLAFTLTESDALLSNAAGTTNAAAEAIEFGRAVVSTGGYPAGGTVRYGRNAKSTAFTAQVDTYVLAYDAAVLYLVEMEVEGVQYSASVYGITNLATTLTALVTAINLAMPANSIIATEASGTTLILTSELAGRPMVTDVLLQAPSGATVDTGSATKTSNAAQATDVTQAIVGVSVYAEDEEVTTIGGTAVSYPANAMAGVLQDGGIIVALASTTTISQGDKVFVELDGTGSDYGKFFAATSATRALLPGWQWERQDNVSDSLAVLRVRAS